MGLDLEIESRGKDREMSPLLLFQPTCVPRPKNNNEDILVDKRNIAFCRITSSILRLMTISLDLLRTMKSRKDLWGGTRDPPTWSSFGLAGAPIFSSRQIRELPENIASHWAKTTKIEEAFKRTLSYSWNQLTRCRRAVTCQKDAGAKCKQARWIVLKLDAKHREARRQITVRIGVQTRRRESPLSF